ncbi:MAG TPA: rRNA maturation RNase YbeY [Halanaerobiales bacterium]|nr:rRNA maturation RNase YbeY [Halanaerobiales bacterium]
MVTIEISNQQKILELNEELYRLFREITAKAGEMEGRNQGEVSFALVDNKTIRELNNKYRALNQATDVLSFPMDGELWGDVVISTEQALAQAGEYEHSLKRELGYLIVHGVLHLLGYDHKTDDDRRKMRQQEEEILKELNLARNREGMN